eukprot:s1933_g8.t1
MVKCYVCRFVEVEKKPGEWRAACDRCAELLKAPPCKACGQPVSREGMHMTAGKILCGSCDVLFGEFFVSGKRNGAEYMREAGTCV